MKNRKPSHGKLENRPELIVWRDGRNRDDSGKPW